MKNTHVPICEKHNIPKEWRPATFEYSDKESTIHDPNVHAWMCPRGCEVLLVPTLCVGILSGRSAFNAAERQGLHSHAECGNENLTTLPIKGKGPNRTGRTLLEVNNHFNDAHLHEKRLHFQSGGHCLHLFLRWSGLETAGSV